MEIKNYQTIFENSYKGKKVFLTGHTGFKGSWMLAWLHQLGADVKGYALTPENEYNLYNRINGDRLCQSAIADIRNRERLKNEMISFQPDFIFHLAAQPLVRLSYSIPAETFEVNTIGTANVLDAVRFLDKPCAVIMITTDKVYDNKEWHYPYRENDRLGGYDPYSASKATAELVISSYQHSFFNMANHAKHNKVIASVRAGNVIGGGDYAKDRIIPDIIRALFGGEPVAVRNPASIRPWQHVLEPIAGYFLLGALLATKPQKFYGAYNFGPLQNDNLPVKTLVEHAIQYWGKGTWVDVSDKQQPHEAHLLKLDINKAVNELGWLPKYNAQQAIENTIHWYKEIMLNNADAFSFTLKQIEDYAR
jgi:CDP-glucose 4,6-dehydratase